MKRIILVLLLLLLVLGMAGCDQPSSPVTALSVSIVETPGCRVLENGVQVEPGENAAFELVLEPGVSLGSTDYPGDYFVEDRGTVKVLHLQNVQYPARVQLELSSVYRTIEYHPNGAAGGSIRLDYDLRFHTRANTEIGTDLFQRRGHTLIGWNTAQDGNGTQIGLGSRVSAPPLDVLPLYAQWVPWTPAEEFIYKIGEFVTITGYHGQDRVVVIPEVIEGLPVAVIASGAFQDCMMERVILPKSLAVVEPWAFQNCGLRELTLFDNIQRIGSDSFWNCPDFQTLHINAIEPPYGYGYRRESCMPDKIDLLIEAQGQKKIVFYGGCSMWYNLDGPMAQEMIGEQWRVINTGVNGVMNSAAQMRIIMAYLEPGDIFFHAPELSSNTQLMAVTALGRHDDKLWCGLEYNYDLVAHLDLREFPDLLDSFNTWLGFKKFAGSYADHYVDDRGRSFFDPMGGIPFPRPAPEGTLVDEVTMYPGNIRQDAMDRLYAYYQDIMEKGTTVYVSYGSVNMDAVPADQQGNGPAVEEKFRQAIEQMEGVTLISRLEDYLYCNEDFFDTNYHLLTPQAQENTRKWLRDLRAQMALDGLWMDENP